MRRRTYLALAGGGVAGLAGCLGFGDGDGGSDGDGGDGDPTPDGTADTPGGTPTGTATETPTETPEPPEAYTPPDDEEDDGAEEEAYRVGEAVEGDQVHLVVEGVDRADRVDFQRPDDGNEFLVVGLATKNVADDHVDVNNLFQVRAEDGEGEYGRSMGVGGRFPFVSGELVPGEVQRGFAPFEVPVGSGEFDLAFEFDPDAVSGVETATFDLGSGADSPTRLEQDLQVATEGVGDMVRHDAVAVTVHDVRVTDAIDDVTQAGEGMEYVLVDAEVESQSSRDEGVISRQQVTVKDGDGNDYRSDLRATSTLDPSFDPSATVRPGEPLRGEHAFEVPVDLEPLYWTFDFDTFSAGDRTVWQLR